MQPRHAGQTQLAMCVRRWPGGRGVIVNIEGIPDYLGVGQFTTKLFLGQSQISLGYEVTANCGSESFSVTGGTLVITPISVPINLGDLNDANAFVNAQFA